MLKVLRTYLPEQLRRQLAELVAEHIAMPVVMEIRHVRDMYILDGARNTLHYTTLAGKISWHLSRVNALVFAENFREALHMHELI